MSASPVARQATQSQNIPSRRVPINDLSELPSDYSTTPGGTLYSTTPGGTRIVYDRNFLMQLRNSPLARTPPSNLPSDLECIIGNTRRPSGRPNVVIPSPIKKDLSNDEAQDQFQMEI